jgi:hypothetical protein
MYHCWTTLAWASVQGESKEMCIGEPTGVSTFQCTVNYIGMHSLATDDRCSVK